MRTFIDHIRVLLNLSDWHNFSLRVTLQPVCRFMLDALKNHHGINTPNLNGKKWSPQVDLRSMMFCCCQLKLSLSFVSQALCLSSNHYSLFYYALGLLYIHLCVSLT